MNIQVFSSRTSELDLKKIRKIRNSMIKPEGGLWTSSYTPEEEYCSEWIGWCYRNQPDWLSDDVYLLYPKKVAKVYTVNDERDMEYLFVDFGKKDFNSSENLKSCIKKPLFNEISIDWELCSREFDGVHFTSYCVRKLRTIYMLINAVDVESTIWFRNVFEKVVRMKDVKNRKCKALAKEILMQNQKVARKNK